MNKTYLIAFACWREKENYMNYNIQWGKSKKDALKKALELEHLKGAKCILVSIRRLKKSLVDLIVEHNKQVEFPQGDSNE